MPARAKRPSGNASQLRINVFQVLTGPPISLSGLVRAESVKSGSPLFFQSKRKRRGRGSKGKLIKPGGGKIDERSAEEVGPITNR